MEDLILIIISLVVLSLTIVTFSKENVDYVSISVLGAIICAALVKLQPAHAAWNIMDAIDINAMIFVFSMQLVTTVVEQAGVFEYVTVKVIRATKGNQRMFFYVIIGLGTLMTAFVGDVIVALIFVPLIIKTCRILEIPSGTYTLGLTVAMILGLVMTPFSSGDNIIIASAFNIGPSFFSIYLLPLAIGLTVLTLILMDHFILRHEEKVEEERKLLLLDLLDESIVIEDRQKFKIAGVGFIALFVCLFAFPSVPPFLFALIIGAILMLAIKRKLSTIFKHIQWDVIFFYICLFIIIGTLDELGLMRFLGESLLAVIGGNIITASVLVLLLASAVTTPLLNSPVVLIFIPIIKILNAGGLPLEPLLVAMILGIQIGGLLPQGSTCEVLALEISKKFNVSNMSYKRMLKVGAAFGGMNLGISLLFVTILSLFYV